jgi:hypothetical protein
MYDDKRRGDDDRIKAESRRMANATGGDGGQHVVGAQYIEQAAPGGRRQGPGRVRRSASARMRARERAGLVVDGGVAADNEQQQHANMGMGGGVGGTMIHHMPTVQETINPDDLIAADVQIDQMDMYYDEEEPMTLGFWHIDKTDKLICGMICLLSVALIVVLGVALST